MPTYNAGTCAVVPAVSVTAPFWYPNSTPPAVLLAGILNHMLTDAGPVTRFGAAGSRTSDDVPLNPATVESPNGPPVTPSVTAL
ncbi:hypothetical protein GCM10009558_052500 [Virgisporangium aurantiacum]